MSTPDLSALPPNVQELIKQAVADALNQQATASAPRELTEHEKLLDHVQRAISSESGETTPGSNATTHFHILSALQHLVTEVEDLSTSVSDHVGAAHSTSDTALVGTPPAATAQVVEGAL